MERYGKTLNVYARDPDTHKLIPGRAVSPLVDSLLHAPGFFRFTEKINGTKEGIVATPEHGLLDYCGDPIRLKIKHSELYRG